MTIRAERVGAAFVVAPDGTLDLATIGSLSDSLVRASMSDLCGPIVVDLDGVTSLDDASLGILLGAAATARRRNRRFAVVCSSQLRGRLTLTGFDRAVDVYAALHDVPTDAVTTQTNTDER